MKNKPLTNAELEEAVKVYNECGGISSRASLKLGIPNSTFRNRLDIARKRGFDVSPKDTNIIADLEGEIRTLKAQLKTFKQDEVNQNYVKRKIIKLAQLEPEIPSWLKKADEKSKVSGVPTLFASDWHWGETVDQQQINNTNKYDLNIAHKRARNMIEIATNLLKQRFNKPEYSGIVFALGGDMVSGDIHEELSITNEVEMMPAVLDLWGVLIWCVERLADEFDNVFIPAVVGNHGRNTQKIRNKNRVHTSFDWLVYQFLAKHFEKDERVKFHIGDGADVYYEVFNHRYLLTHGDQFRGGDGMIGALGPIIRGDHRKSTRNAQINFEYDTMLLGHWHQLIQLQRLIVNGSLKGYDEYAYINNFPFEPPRQALWLTHPEYGITFSAPILVDNFERVNQSEWVKWK